MYLVLHKFSNFCHVGGQIHLFLQVLFVTIIYNCVAILKSGQVKKQEFALQRANYGRTLFSSPGRSPGRAIILPPASALTAASALAKFYVKVFHVMGKALSGELSCPCDRSYFRRVLACFSRTGKTHGDVSMHYNRYVKLREIKHT